MKEHGLERFARVFAEAGFVVLAPRFPITYTGATDGPLGRAADIAQQPADVSFVLDQVLSLPDVVVCLAPITPATPPRSIISLCSAGSIPAMPRAVI